MRLDLSLPDVHSKYRTSHFHSNSFFLCFNNFLNSVASFLSLAGRLLIKTEMVAPLLLQYL